MNELSRNYGTDKNRQKAKEPKNKYNIGDKVRHTNNPDIVYIVQAIFADGSYRIIPLNADFSQTITFATENCMSLYDETKERACLNPEEELSDGK